ncbi:MAG: hypothetical protein IBJ11_09690 [Phycisphaerales bacterium]|nr:hypothetical protein [Phycisphaerales bacterium]
MLPGFEYAFDAWVFLASLPLAIMLSMHVVRWDKAFPAGHPLADAEPWAHLLIFAVLLAAARLIEHRFRRRIFARLIRLRSTPPSPEAPARDPRTLGTPVPGDVEPAFGPTRANRVLTLAMLLPCVLFGLFAILLVHDYDTGVKLTGTGLCLLLLVLIQAVRALRISGLLPFSIADVSIGGGGVVVGRLFGSTTFTPARDHLLLLDDRRMGSVIGLAQPRGRIATLLLSPSAADRLLHEWQYHPERIIDGRSAWE